MSHPFHIVFSGSGATGHLYPGLTIARHVAERLPNCVITFIGSRQAAERHAVRAAGFQYASIPSQPPPQNALRAVRFVTDNIAGYWASRWLLRERYVSLVVGLGGYASAATARAASARGIPSVLLEQNVVPGRATRWLASSATTVCAGFSQTQAYFGAKVSLRITGNPVRPAFEALYRRQQAGGREHGAGSSERRELPAPCPLPPAPCPRRLIVIGGVGGARSLNQFMPKALARLGSRLAGWEIVHQSGEGQLQETFDRYHEAQVAAVVVSYIDELAPLLFESDLVVCRAGGTTLSELALAGVPAVLVPYPNARESYQLANAEVFAEAGAAKLIDEAELDSPLDDALVAALQPLITRADERHAMAANMQRLARPDAAAEIAETIYGILRGASARLAA